MKKNYFKQLVAVCALFTSVLSFSQVGIKTPSPHPSADLELGSNNKALYLNRVANTGAIANPQAGMMIYDLTDKCVKVYQGEPVAWSNCFVGNPGGGNGTVSALTCTSATFSPAVANQGQSYSGTLSVPYDGGNGGGYPAQTITSTGVTGFTATLTAGNFSTGSGSLNLSVNGTSSTAGTASFALNIGGQSCSVTLPVNQNGVGVIPGTVTLGQNRRYWVASVYDQNYLPYTAPTALASTSVVNADGTNEAVVVNVQGTVTTAGVTVQIPVASVTGSGTVNAWTSIITIPASLTEDGISRQLELSWGSQSYTASTKFITATIKAIGGTLNAKKLDINAGIGSDYLGVLLGAFSYPYNNAGNTTSYEVRDIPGIPDKMFGQTDNTPAAGQRHNFLYLPLQGEDGNIWLNNNLGANYSNLSSPAFNLTQQATSPTDYNAYGSLFQWGRKPDGHELTNYTNATTATLVNGTTPTRANVPNHSNVIIITTSNYDWRTTSDSSLWATESSTNNPCPNGFAVPTNAQYQAYITAASLTDPQSAANSNLKFTLAGQRLNINGISGVPTTGAYTRVGTEGNYWTGTTFPPTIYYTSGYMAIRPTGNVFVDNSVGSQRYPSQECTLRKELR